MARACAALAAAGFVLAAGAGVGAASEVSAADAAKTLLLIDANRDMAAGAAGAKFDLQRHALEASPLAATATISMAAYGGERCGGFAALGGVSERGLGDLLGGITPDGRRNLGAAIESAIETFPADAPRKRIVAIVGGPNQCLAALCAQADRLKARRPEVVVDVIGFGLTDADARRLHCVAANTGGRFTRADDHGLATALALALAPPSDVLGGLQRPSAVPARPAVVARDDTAADAAPNEPAATPPDALAFRMSGPELSFPRGLRVSAALTTGGPPLERGLKFELLRRGADGVLRLVARTERTANPLFGAPPGAYVARVTFGEFVREARVTLPTEGVANQRIVLDAGQIELTAAVNGRSASRGASFRVERLDAKSEPIEYSGRGRMIATLPAGKYRVTARIDSASALSVVEVEPGRLTRHAFDVPLGFLRVSAPDTAGGFRILQDGREVAQGGVGEALLRLAPGVYQIVAVDGRSTATAVAEVENGRIADVALVADTREAGVRRLIAAQPETFEAAFSR